MNKVKKQKPIQESISMYDEDANIQAATMSKVAAAPPSNTEHVSFKDREKRKRDIGQASRLADNMNDSQFIASGGKSYNEEEKRALKESTASGLGFD